MCFERVKEIVVDTVNCDALVVTMEASIKNDVGLDSLDAMELRMAIEEAFGLQIEEAAVADFVTVGDIVTYIEGKLR